MVSGFGSIVADILMVSPTMKYNHKNLVDFQKVQIGGVIPSALMVLSKLGIKTQLMTVVGEDEFGQRLVSILKNENVGIGKIKVMENTNTPLAFVIVNKKNGKRTSFYTTGEFSSVESKYFKADFPKDTKLFLTDGHNVEASKELIMKAKEKNIKILLDLGSPKRGINKLIGLSDVIIVPKAYWHEVWPKMSTRKIAEKLLNLGHSIVVLTMEDKGSLVGSKNKIFHQKAYKVTEADTNGAGDVFFGAFSYGFFKNWTLEKTAEFASAAASLSCTKIGKEEKIPKLSEVWDFINNNGLVKN